MNIALGSGQTAEFDGALKAQTLTVSGAGKVQFDGAVTATALNITSTGEAEINAASGITTTTFTEAGTLDLNETLTGDIAFGAAGDGLVTLLGGKNITGTVNNTSGSDGLGTLTIEAGGDSTISGLVGATNTLKAVNIQAGLGHTATFSSAVNATTVNITGSGTAAFEGTVTADIDFSGDGIATLSNTKNLTGDVTSASGEGTFTLLGAHTINGNIGSTLPGNNGLRLVTVGNGAITINGDVRALAVNFAGDNELSIGSGYGITGAVTTTINNTGTLTFAGSTSTGGTIGASGKALKVLNFNGATSLSHDIFATNTYIKSGSTVTMSGDTVITGNLNLNNASDAVFDLGLNTLTLAGNYTQNDNSRLQIALSDADWGRINTAGSPNISGSSTLDIDVTGLLAGAAFTVMDCDSSGTIGDLSIVVDSPLFTIRKTTSNEDLILNVTRFKTYSDMGLNPNAVAAGQSLDNALPSAAGDMRVVLGELDAMDSQQEISSAMDSMEPITDGVQTTISNDILNKFIGTTILRLQDSKIEEGEGEKVTSEINPQNDIWVQFYGDYAYQGKRGLSNGYQAKIWGTVIGIDRLFNEGALRLGLAQGFGFSKVRSKDNYGRTSIDSYQTGLYGEYQGKDKPYIFDAVLTYGYNNYDSSRHISVGSINRTAQSDCHGLQFSSYFEAGYKLQKKGFDIIPFLALNYTYLYLSGYTEKGADSLNLTVNSQKYDSLQPGIGLRLSRAFENKSGIITPEFRFRYFYDTINDKQQTIASFAGGGTSFKTIGYKPDPSSFDLGARIEFFNKKNITLLVDCNTVLKEDYYEAGGSLTFKYSF